MRVYIESKFHKTRTYVIVDKYNYVTERAMREAVSRLCSGRKSGACACPITVECEGHFYPSTHKNGWDYERE